ncbi:hypothetical protein EJB05_53177 [Eragrostis curvula]|uniref:Uncharacterized protein n=1 Tax=Eragrostis curvula TaxID=38414 RepID=A0A5J9SR12_9POAL|nr:hypothetical protein EJB05_53177 [Eragrostis curvula]
MSLGASVQIPPATVDGARQAPRPRRRHRTADEVVWASSRLPGCGRGVPARSLAGQSSVCSGRIVGSDLMVLRLLNRLCAAPSAKCACDLSFVQLSILSKIGSSFTTEVMGKFILSKNWCWYPSEQIIIDMA